MKRWLISILIMVWTISCFGQEVEFCTSLNTSSEQRLQNAMGIGLQYQHDLNQKFKIGLGIHYNFNSASFDHIPYIDADPFAIATQRINSSAHRFSLRLNLQGLLKNNDYISFSLGPEISYNYLWGQDQIKERVDRLPNPYNFSNHYKLTQKIGFGLISKIEIKDIITKQLSLCFTIRPEVVLGNMKTLIGVDQPAFFGQSGFAEFQIGLKYRFRK